MKSSRSFSTRNIRRNARRVMSESSDSDGRDSANEIMDSARAEKLFSRRKLKKPTSVIVNTSTNESVHTGDKTLFKVSDTSDSESCQKMETPTKKSSKYDNISINEMSTDGRSISEDSSFFKPSKKDLFKYRNVLQSSDDEQSERSSFDMLKDTSISKESSVIVTDHSGEDCILEEFIDESKDKSIKSSNITTNDTFFITPSKLGRTRNNKQGIISDCDDSDDSDVGKTATKISDINDTFYTTPSKLGIKRNNKQRIISDSESDDSDVGKTVPKNSDINVIKINLESESDDDIINSSNEIFPTLRADCGKSNIASKLKDLSLVEPSDSDTSVIYKSTIASSDQNHPFFNDSTFSNIANSLFYPQSQSSILENPVAKLPIKNVSNQKQIETIILDDDSPKSSKLFNQNQQSPTRIKLNESDEKKLNTKFPETSKVNSYNNNSKKLTSVNFESLKMENLSNQKQIETIILDDDIPKSSKLFNQNQQSPTKIKLNESDKKKLNTKSPEASKVNAYNNNSKKLTSVNFESLRMEKLRLEEHMKQFTKNIDNMKVTMRITNLGLLPDGGLKLKNAISKEERSLKDTEMQLKNVLDNLKQFPEELKIAETNQIVSSNIDSALTKKATAYINTHEMGQKALNTYRTQQAMTLDVLTNLHNSLETCPSPNIMADDPPGLKVKLMPHQKHAIAWLMWRESGKPHGGILADDMGLGKTLTMISLILKASEEEKNSFDSDDSSENLQRNTIKGGTLIICPSSLISQWENEVKTKLRPRIFDVVQHYGPNRETSLRRLARKDIVITTYHVVMWDQKSHQHSSPLFQIKWKRIILDEAHTIRNYKSQTSLAVCALKGVNRWALSGTPIHNKEADFFALLKFIKCSPFDEWAVWKRWIGNNDEAGRNRLSLLVKALMLRRTKVELSEAPSFKLPTKEFHTIKVELNKEEKEAYEKVLLFSSSLFSTYLYEKAEKENAVERGFPTNNKVKYLHQQNLNDDIFKDHPELDRLFKQLKNKKDIQAHHILVLLLRLRQLCCHPCLMKNMLESETLKVDGIQDTGDLDLVDHMSRMSIGLPNVQEKTLVNNNPIFNDSWISSKIKSVCDMVKDKVLLTDDKAVIVSQWPSMLHLIEKQLSQYKVKTEMFSGAVPVPLRNKVVSEFNNAKGGAKILLLSLTAGGVGLNLVAANHLFLVDIHWNPQLEAQACDRIYRLGQTKPVNIYKFICENTIETTIQSIQSHKLLIANNLFGGCSNVEGTKITLEDLKQIFNVNPNYK